MQSGSAGAWVSPAGNSHWPSPSEAETGWPWQCSITAAVGVDELSLLGDHTEERGEPASQGSPTRMGRMHITWGRESHPPEPAEPWAKARLCCSNSLFSRSKRNLHSQVGYKEATGEGQQRH